MKKNFYQYITCIAFIASGLCISTNVSAQVTVGSKGVPNQGALLDMKQEDKTDGSANSKKGLGLPRVALTAVDKLDPCVVTTGVVATDDAAKKSHIGLTVYNTTDNTSTAATLSEGVYAWDGAMWTQYSGTTAGGAENGLSMSGRKVILGGPLNQPTTITGDATNNLALNTPTKVGGTLGVTGATTLGSTLGVTGVTSLRNTNVTGNVAITGNETISGTLGVTGATTTKATNVTGVMKYTNTTPTVGQYLSAANADGTVAWTTLPTLPATATNTEPWRIQGGMLEATQPTDATFVTGNVAIGSNTSGTNKLQVTGNTNIIGTATTTGSSVVTGNSKTGTSTVTGNETVGGTLAVAGATTLTGNLASNGVTTTKATNVTGVMKYTNTTPVVGQYLSATAVDGTAEWTTLPATATNTEPWRKQGGTAEATAPADNAYMTGNVAIGSNTSGTNKLQVTGNTNIIGTATTTGSSVVTGNSTTGTSTVTGNATVGGTLGVTGATTLTGNLTSNGVTTTKVTNVTGALTYTGTTPVAGHVLTSSDATGKATWTVPAVNGAANGTQVVSNKVELGGALTKGTTIAQAANSFAITSTNTSTSSATFGTNNAALNLTSPNKGFMPPRVALTGVHDNTTIPLTAADKGMTVYNIGTAFKEGLYTWSGAAWTELITQLPPATAVNLIDLRSAVIPAFGNQTTFATATTLDFGTIRASETGNYAILLRLYGHIQKSGKYGVPNNSNAYIFIMKNGVVIDAQEVSFPVVTMTPPPVIALTSALAAPNLTAGDVITIRLCTNIDQIVEWLIEPEVLPHANRTSLLFWKM